MSIPTRALVTRSHENVGELEYIELPEPQDDEVVVEIAGVGLCHTDLLPRSADFKNLRPIICGHEGAGRVVHADRAERLPVGTPVVLSFDSCRRCMHCVQGHPAYCDQFLQRNLTGHGPSGAEQARDRAGQPIASRWFGQSSFSERVIAQVPNAVPVEDTADLWMMGALGCGLQTGAGAILNSLALRAGESVAVYGVGGVGLAAVMAARLAGAQSIIAVDRTPSRLRLAEELGATSALEPERANRRELLSLTGGGVDAALDTTGSGAVVAAAVGALRTRGRLGLVGASVERLELPLSELVFGKTVTGILEGDAQPSHFIPELIAHWRAGRFPFERLIERFGLSDYAAAEESARAGRVVKPVLVP